MATNTAKQSKKDFVKKHKGLFITLLTLFILAVLLVFAVQQLSPMAEKQLLDIANRELAPNARIEIDHFSLGVLPPRIELEGIHLVHTEPFEDQTPQKPLDTIRKLNIQSASLSGLHLLRLIRGKAWSLGNLSLDGIDAELVPTSTDRLTDSSPLEQPLDVTIADIRISNSDFKLFANRESESPVYSLGGISLHIENLSVTDADSPLHTYFENFDLSVDSAEHFTENGYYHFAAEEIIANSFEEIFTINRFQALPQLSAYEIAADLGRQLDVYTVQGGPFTFHGLQINEWFENENIRLNYAELNDFSIIIEREKTFERPPRDDRLLPNRKLRDLPYSVQADSIRWSDGEVRYTEQYSDRDRSGTIMFTDIQLLIESLQNQAEEEVIPVSATARFMDRGNLTLNFEFFADEFASHTIRATLDEMNLIDANNPLINLAGIRVTEGHLTSLDFMFSANDHRSEGELRMIYNNLSLRILDDETMEENRGTRFRSFFANTFAVRSGNDAEDPRVGTIEFERKKERSVFNYWWKSIKTGLEDVIRR